LVGSGSRGGNLGGVRGGKLVHVLDCKLSRRYVRVHRIGEDTNNNNNNNNNNK
jgi:hypothetical protein